MGTADLVPGVSGGTIAFILGIYERLINAIKGLGTKNWDPKFLIPLVSGIAIAISTLAHGLESLLNHELWRSHLYSAFLGMILGSTLFCAKQVKAWYVSRFLGLGIGLVASFVLTGHLDVSYHSTDPSSLWIATCGAIAISAMLLPGVSGSYLLTILGIYPLVIQNLNTLTAGLAHGLFEASAFQFMALLLLGIVLGAVVFSRVVSWSLKHFHDMTIATLTGFMLGGIPSVWPFWIYDTVPHALKPEKGLVLVPKQMILPDVSSNIFLLGIFFAVLGFVWVLWAEWFAAEPEASTQ